MAALHRLTADPRLRYLKGSLNGAPRGHGHAVVEGSERGNLAATASC